MLPMHSEMLFYAKRITCWCVLPPLGLYFLGKSSSSRFLGEPITAKPSFFLAENHSIECRFSAGNALIYQKSASLLMRTGLTDACLSGQRHLSSSNLAKW
jgi:hypothetical protein